MKLKNLILLIVMIMSISLANAQVTTSSLTGVVTDGNGEELPGATVVAVHIPSGTQYACVTNVMGRYFIQGMRPGGPYKVTIQFVGQKPDENSSVRLSLGETYNHSVKLQDDNTELEEVVVLAKNKFDAAKTGASQRVTSSDIANMPSLSGSIADMTRMNPQIVITQLGAMCFAGQSNRYNSFQIDGAASNDVFGLAETGTNGGKSGAQPISMETIDQIQVSVAPFDVRQGGFTGGTINAVTKSGTNEVHGSVYGYWRNQGLVGNYELMNGKESDKMIDYTDYRAGFTVGGPIVKDKLFFFANYERADKESQNNFAVGSTGSKIDAAKAQEALSIMKSKYGYTGSFATSDDYMKSDKMGLKLDWNISTRHKASVSWRMVQGKLLRYNSSETYLNASDYMYDLVSNTNTITAELQSRINDHVSNEFQASYVRVRDEQDPHGKFPCVQVLGVGGKGVDFGTERSTAANYVHQDVYSLTDNVTIYKGNHTLTFGTHDEFYKFANLFIQDFYGTYTFNSVDDLRNGVIGSYKYQYANTDVTGTKRWAPEFWAGQLAFYAQDKWNVTRDLDLTYGLRADITMAFSEPTENAGFNAYIADRGYNVKTNQKIKNTPMWSPRVGFHWNIGGNEWNTLRGGVGLFSGRIPFVWYCNNFSKTGIQLQSYSVSKGDALKDLVLIPSIDNQDANVQTLKADGSQEVNVFADDFKFVQNLRVNLAYDFRLGGVDWTLEGIFSKNINDIYYQNLAVDVDGDKTVASELDMPWDTRPYMHRVSAGTDYSTILLLDNTNKGYSFTLSFGGNKSFDCGLSLYAGYTYTQAKSICCANSNQASSAYNYNYTYTNPNNPELANSAYAMPHRVTASATYAKEYGNGHWKSTLSLIYTGQTGSAYSIYYYGDLNGDGFNNNDLLYIPTDAQIDQMKFRATDKVSADQQRADMKSWIAGDDYLSSHRGQYYERYADWEDFENHFDFHFAQQFRFKAGKQTHAIEFSFDIMNVSNMFSKKWGRYSSWAGAFAYYSPVTYKGDGEFQFLNGSNYNMRSYNDEYSRWRGQIGIKYIF